MSQGLDGWGVTMTASKNVLDVPPLLQMHVKHVKQVKRRCMAVGKVPGVAALWM